MRGQKIEGSAQAERVNLPSLPLSVLFKPSVNWRMPTHPGESISFIWSANKMLTSPEDILTDTPRNNPLPALWAVCNPVKLTHKINHHKPLRATLTRPSAPGSVHLLLVRLAESSTRTTSQRLGIRSCSLEDALRCPT